MVAAVLDRRPAIRLIDGTGRSAVMNWDEVKGNWMQLKGAVREKWGDLTDDDLDRIAGDREQFVGRLQERYGQTREEAERNVDEFVRDHGTGTY
jgi:uncharacterized protein YjbJ (UPF0337 family)